MVLRLRAIACHRKKKCTQSCGRCSKRRWPVIGRSSWLTLFIRRFSQGTSQIPYSQAWRLDTESLRDAHIFHSQRSGEVNPPTVSAHGCAGRTCHLPMDYAFFMSWRSYLRSVCTKKLNRSWSKWSKENRALHRWSPRSPGWSTPASRINTSAKPVRSSASTEPITTHTPRWMDCDIPTPCTS